MAWNLFDNQALSGDETISEIITPPSLSVRAMDRALRFELYLEITDTVGNNTVTINIYHAKDDESNPPLFKLSDSPFDALTIDTIEGTVRVCYTGNMIGHRFAIGAQVPDGVTSVTISAHVFFSSLTSRYA